MVEYNSSERLSGIFKVLSDPTRRSILTELCQQGPCRVTDLAAFYDMSLNAVSKHVKTMEKAGMVERNSYGREHWISANLEQVGEIQSWLGDLKSIWQSSLDQLQQEIGDNND